MGDAHSRGISTPVGIVLLVALTVALGTIFIVGLKPLGEERPESVPTASIDVDFDTGGDGTFADSGDGGPCAGDTYEDDDSFTAELVAGDTIQTENLAVVVGETRATHPPCSGGSGTLDEKPSRPDEISAGTRITVWEGDGNDAIRPGATVKFIWTDPSSDEQYVIASEEVP